MLSPLLASYSFEELTEQGQNSLYLKEQATQLLQQLGSGNWTDHNTADPGITLLEVLSFAISDLSYRLSFPVSDLLSPDLSAENKESRAFYLPQEILPSNMVTNADIRQAIIDIVGVKNVAVLPSKQTSDESTENTFDITSVRLLLELEPDYAALPLRQQQPLLNKVRERFLCERNVNQDLQEILVLEPKPIALKMALGLQNVADPVTKLVEILSHCAEVISPNIHKYTQQALLEKGFGNDEIYTGPLPKNGFVKPHSLDDVTLPSQLFSSDVLDVLTPIVGLQDISGFSFFLPSSDIDNDSENAYWRIAIPEGQVPTFDFARTLDLLQLSIDGQAIELDALTRQQVLAELEGAESSTGDFPQPEMSDVISSRYRQLNQYVSIQKEFPAIYKLSENRMDGTNDPAEYAQILQLKGFLTLFDQILADETAQLDNLRQLLAIPDKGIFQRLMCVFNTMLASEALSATQIQQFWQDVRALPRTYLSQPVLDVSGVGHLLKDYVSTYKQQGFQQHAEPALSGEQLFRLTSAFDHLLTRFAEQRLDAGLLKYRPVFAHYEAEFSPIPADISQDQSILDKLVSLKVVLDLAATLSNYPKISRQRTGGINYLSLQDFKTEPAGLLHRLSHFLGWSHLGEIPLAVTNRESVYLLESELVRHGTNSETYQANQLYFVIPEWPSRFANTEYRKLLEQQLREQTPVHQQAFVVALPRQLMSLFERLYFSWLNAMSQKSLLVTNVGTQEQISVPDSAHSNAHIALLSGYLRQFIQQPDKLLQQILETMRDNSLPNPWQPVLEAINNWLEVPKSEQISGTNYNDIVKALASYLSQHSMPNDVEPVLFAIAHHHLIEMFNPNGISEATINDDFRIGYQPLDYLKPSYPVGQAYINTGGEGTPNFTVRINDPLSI